VHLGAGCQGVLTEATPSSSRLLQLRSALLGRKGPAAGEKAAKRLTADQWQFKSKGRQGTTRVKKNGEIVTRLVQDACIFLNRPDFHRGPGCALHVMAIDNEESYIPLKPEVCWQLPLRRDDEVEDDGHVITRISQWNRSHWGAGGADFHWWCTEDPNASSARTASSTRCPKSWSRWSVNTSTTNYGPTWTSAQHSPRAPDFPPRYAKAGLTLGGEGVLFIERRSGQRTQNLVVTVLFGETPLRVDVFGRGATFHTGGGAGAGRAFEFASFNKRRWRPFFTSTPHWPQSITGGDHNQEY